MIRANYHITERQADQLKSIAQKTGLSVAELIRRAIDAYLEAETRRAEK